MGKYVTGLYRYNKLLPLLYVLVLITSLICPGFTHVIVQFDKSMFKVGVNPLSGDLTIEKLDLHL